MNGEFGTRTHGWLTWKLFPPITTKQEGTFLKKEKLLCFFKNKDVFAMHEQIEKTERLQKGYSKVSQKDLHSPVLQVPLFPFGGNRFSQFPVYRFRKTHVKTSISVYLYPPHYFSYRSFFFF